MQANPNPVVVFSFTEATHKLAVAQGQAAAALGQAGETCYYITQQETSGIKAIHDGLAKSFTNVKRLPFQRTLRTKTAIENEMFFAAANYFANNHQVPWLYLEPTVVPTKRKWLDQIYDDYVRNRSLVMGSLIKGGETDCGILVRRRLAKGIMFSHETLWAIPTLAALLRYTSAMEGQGAEMQPYDIYCATEFMRWGSSTDLIGYYPASVKYGVKEGDYVFSAENEDLDSVQRFLCPRQSIPSSVVLASGCTDGTLHELVAAKDVLPPHPTNKEINLAARGKGPVKLSKNGKVAKRARSKKVAAKRKAAAQKVEPTAQPAPALNDIF
jgi:hypothetical protein